MKAPEPGEIAEVTVDWFSENGNGFVELEDGDHYPLNVGPVSEEALESPIEVQRFEVPPDVAYCLTESALERGYPKEMISMAKHSGNGWTIPEEMCPKPGDTLELDTVRISRSGNPVGSHKGFDVLLDGIEIEIDDPNLAGTEVDEDIRVVASISRRSGGSCSADVIEVLEGPANLERSENDNQNDLEPETTSSNPTTDSRERAENAGKKEPSSPTGTTYETTNYSRSTVVKEYVLDRADGVCEGCGEPAPFLNSDGDPYLEAHHIHELSEGGADTPETVMALCPNCHYKVHYGQNGDEYNQTLAQRLSDIENTSVDCILERE